ncbi:hypothetical protein DM01DRAFT_1378179 [Hesseltinella vesiculosa]|uniref:Uncharacterized protein n=1 Tax=Hesseltinella vesiculosa TaxID=101127 RepID=A0A1X2G578_9FUNG|nr:hypothetical protein DM01DRAFT_1378179 [Hesseltinella vesiculosa]
MQAEQSGSHAGRTNKPQDDCFTATTTSHHQRHHSISTASSLHIIQSDPALTSKRQHRSTMIMPIVPTPAPSSSSSAFPLYSSSLPDASYALSTSPASHSPADVHLFLGQSNNDVYSAQESIGVQLSQLPPELLPLNVSAANYHAANKLPSGSLPPSTDPDVISLLNHLFPSAV